MEQCKEYGRLERKSIASDLRANTEERVSSHGGKELCKEQGRSDQEASRGKGEKLAEKVERDWAKEMHHMLGKIRHRLKRHRDRARSPPRHRRSIENNQVSSSLALPGSQSQTSSRTSSHSSKSLTSSSRSRTSSLASPSSQSLTASSPSSQRTVSPHRSSSPTASSCWPALERTITSNSQISSQTVLPNLQVSSHASSNNVQVSSPTMNSKLRPAEPSITEPGPKDDTTQTTGYLPKYPEYLKQSDRDENGIRLGKVKEQLPRQLEDQSQLFLVGTGIGALSTTTVLLKLGQAVSGGPNGDDSNQRGANGTRNSTTRGVEVKKLLSRTMLGVTLRHSSTDEAANGIEVLLSSLSPDKRIQVEENAGVHDMNTNSAMAEKEFTQGIVSQETKATIPFRKLLVVEHSLLIDEPTRKRKEQFSDLGLWRLENVNSHDCTVVHNCCRLLKFYETNPDITNNSVIDTSCRTEKWMKNGELYIGLVTDNELSNLNNIKSASSTLIVSQAIILEESHERRETLVASECLKSTATNETALDISSAGAPFVIVKEQVLKLLAQQSGRYWEGRGSRMKMKFKIKAVSYHPP